MWFTRGLALTVGGAPRQRIDPVAPPSTVGLLGADYPGLRLRATVAEGDAVAAGQRVLEDRADPRIAVAAPVAGRVASIEIGARRRLSALVIEVEPAPDSGPGTPAPRPADGDGAQALLLASGLWTALRARPFGRVPRPGTAPAAIFVMATAGDANAADPAVVLKGEAEALAEGLACLTLIPDGQVFLCQPPGPALAAPLPRGVTLARQALPFTAAASILRNCPPDPARPVWEIAADDAAALGRLILTGRAPGDRVAALGGPLARDPRLLRLPLGADIGALAAAEALPGPRRVLSGPVLSGMVLSGAESRFLRRRDRQVTILPRIAAVEAPPRGWRLPGRVKRAPFIPHAALEAAMPPGVATVPLLRALAAGDAAAAARLGAYGLLEEDLALVTYAAGGAEDFALRLREALDALEAEA